jgi:hypothetical protein
MNDILEVVGKVQDAVDKLRNTFKRKSGEEDSDDEEEDEDEEITIIMGTGETLEIKNIEDIIENSVNKTEKKK